MKNKGVNGAGYEILRRMLGVTVEEAAVVHGVPVATIQAWIADKKPVPKSAVEVVEELLRRRLEMVARLLAEVEAAPKGAVAAIHCYRSQAEFEASPHYDGSQLGYFMMTQCYLAQMFEQQGLTFTIQWGSDIPDANQSARLN